ADVFSVNRNAARNISFGDDAVEGAAARTHDQSAYIFLHEPASDVADGIGRAYRHHFRPLYLQNVCNHHGSPPGFGRCQSTPQSPESPSGTSSRVNVKNLLRCNPTTYVMGNADAIGSSACDPIALGIGDNIFSIFINELIL